MAKPSRALLGALLLTAGASTPLSGIAEPSSSDDGRHGYYRVAHDGYGDGYDRSEKRWHHDNSDGAEGKHPGATSMQPKSDKYGHGSHRDSRDYDRKRGYGDRRYGYNSRYGRKYGHKRGYGDHGYGNRGYGHNRGYGNRGYGHNRGYGNRGYGIRGYGNKRGYGNHGYGNKRGYGYNRGYGSRGSYGHRYPSTPRGMRRYRR